MFVAICGRSTKIMVLIGDRTQGTRCDRRGSGEIEIRPLTTRGRNRFFILFFVRVVPRAVLRRRRLADGRRLAVCWRRDPVAFCSNGWQVVLAQQPAIRWSVKQDERNGHSGYFSA